MTNAKYFLGILFGILTLIILMYNAANADVTVSVAVKQSLQVEKTTTVKPVVQGNKVKGYSTNVSQIETPHTNVGLMLQATPLDGNISVGVGYFFDDGTAIGTLGYRFK